MKSCLVLASLACLAVAHPAMADSTTPGAGKKKLAGWCTTSSQPGGVMFTSPFFPVAEGVTELQAKQAMNRALRLAYQKSLTPPTQCQFVTLETEQLNLLGQKRAKWIQTYQNMGKTVEAMTTQDFKSVAPGK